MRITWRWTSPYIIVLAAITIAQRYHLTKETSLKEFDQINGESNVDRVTASTNEEQTPTVLMFYMTSRRMLYRVHLAPFQMVFLWRLRCQLLLWLLAVLCPYLCLWWETTRQINFKFTCIQVCTNISMCRFVHVRSSYSNCACGSLSVYRTHLRVTRYHMNMQFCCKSWTSLWTNHRRKPSWKPAFSHKCDLTR